MKLRNGVYLATILFLSFAASASAAQRDEHLVERIEGAARQALELPEIRSHGISLLEADVQGDLVTLDFSREILNVRLGSAELEEILQKVLFRVGEANPGEGRTIEYFLTVEGTPLHEILVEADRDSLRELSSVLPPQNLSSPALSSRRIAISPGHGWYYTGSAWKLQRSYFWGIVEDFVNWDITNSLYNLLVSTGADVRPTRNMSKSAGNGESGYPKWQEAARYHIKALGAPSSVWNQPGLNHYDQDIRSRPLYANYVGADILVSIHNNGGGGKGTETWYDTDNGHQTESKRLAQVLHAKIVGAIRSNYNSSWTDRGVKGANGSYGENRLATRPAVVLEIAFMDTQTPDNTALQSATFKSLVAKAIKEGIEEYFGETSAKPDLRVTALSAPTSGLIGGQIQISSALVNQGSAPAGAFRQGFYLSTDQTITQSDVFTGWSCSFSGLAAGSNGTCNGPVGIPSSLSPGTYYLGVIVDDLGAIAETSESNNSRAADTGSIKLAHASDTTPPSTSITGGPSGTITSSTASLTWTGDDNVTPKAGLVYAFRLSPLESSFSAFGSTTSKTYSGLPNGSYTFYVKARDQAGNEDSTPASRSFTVSVASACSPAATLACGSTVSGRNDAAGSTRLVPSYPCLPGPRSTPWSYSGPEYTYIFTPPSNTHVQLDLTNSGDLDMVVLRNLSGACAAGNCISHQATSGSQERVRFGAVGGHSYYVVVDGFGGSVGNYTLRVTCDGPTFSDVPTGAWGFDQIQAIYNAGVTQGCQSSPRLFCPTGLVTRADAAVLLERARYGRYLVPPNARGIFADVPSSDWRASWIEYFYNEGITRGCSSGPLKYCPGRPVTRAEMAVFLLRAKYSGSYSPPLATGLFVDVPMSHWAAGWVEQLYREGITGGCGTSPRQFCPDANVTRAELAIFLTRTFNLPMP